MECQHDQLRLVEGGYTRTRHLGVVVTYPHITFDTGPDDDAVEFPWCLVEDGGVSDRFASATEAGEALVRSTPAPHLNTKRR